MSGHPTTLGDDGLCGKPLPAPEAISGTVAGSILREAAGIVEGARNTTHGDKERSFQCIADFWAVYDNYNQRENSPRSVADKMVLLKLARALCGTPVRDHFVDMAGYAGVSGELAGC